MSGSGSVEVSVPTDLTVTTEGDSEDDFRIHHKQPREQNACMTEKSELQRLVEKLKLELQNKDIILATITAQQEGVLEKVLSQKDDVFSSKQITITRLQNELTHTREELQTFRERAARELAQLTQKCVTFKENHKRLTVRQDELRQTLDHLSLREEELVELRNTPPQNLSLQQFVSLRVYELVWPLRMTVNRLQAENGALEAALSAKESSLKGRMDQLVKCKEELDVARAKEQEHVAELMRLKEDCKEEDFRVRNYARVKAERNQLEEEKEVAMKEKGEITLTLEVLRREKIALDKQYNEVKSRCRTIEHDFRQLSETHQELMQRYERVSAELNSVGKLLKIERERNSDMHEKFVLSRGEVSKLKDTNEELEREGKYLGGKLKAVNECCDELRQCVENLTGKLALAVGESDKWKAVHEHDSKALTLELAEIRSVHLATHEAKCHLVNKCENLQKELTNKESDWQRETTDQKSELNSLRRELSQTKVQLAKYEALEAEFKRSVQAAASLPPGSVEGKLLFTGASWLAESQGVSQTVELTRQVLQLERQNSEAFRSINKLTTALRHLGCRVGAYKSALGLAGQPERNLLNRIALQEEQMFSMKECAEAHEKLNGKLREDNLHLREELRRDLGLNTRHVREIKELKRRVESLFMGDRDRGSKSC